jgi:hypothetical protein
VTKSRQLSLGGVGAEPKPKGKAIFSEDGVYRYLLEWPLESQFKTPRSMLMIGLNPSIATAYKLDPTLTRFSGFGTREGCTGILVANLYAFVSTDPRGLGKVADPVGPENDRYIVEASARADIIVCAWGAHPMAAKRAPRVLKLLERFDLWCFGLNADGSPKHPLYLPATAPLVPYARED